MITRVLIRRAPSVQVAAIRLHFALQLGCLVQVRAILLHLTFQLGYLVQVSAFLLHLALQFRDLLVSFALNLGRLALSLAGLDVYRLFCFIGSCFCVGESADRVSNLVSRVGQECSQRAWVGSRARGASERIAGTGRGTYGLRLFQIPQRLRRSDRPVWACQR